MFVRISNVKFQILYQLIVLSSCKASDLKYTTTYLRLCKRCRRRCQQTHRHSGPPPGSPGSRARKPTPALIPTKVILKQPSPPTNNKIDNWPSPNLENEGIPFDLKDFDPKYF